MRFKILLPNEVFADKEVSKIIAEAPNGSFCLLQRHIDYTSALVPGLLTIRDLNGKEELFAVDEGILVKKGNDVMVSTRNALTVKDLGDLKDVVAERFKAIDDREKAARTVAARLEADLVRRFMEIK